MPHTPDDLAAARAYCAKWVAWLRETPDRMDEDGQTTYGEAATHLAAVLSRLSALEAERKENEG